MNSLERLVDLLEVFGEPPGIFTADHLHSRLGYTRSTLYRYLKTLTDAGLVTSLHGSGFSLGPKIIELNAAIVSRDPLIAAARPHLVALSRQFRGATFLCRRFRDRVLCVHQETSAEAPAINHLVGTPAELTRGAAGRIILAHLPSAQVRRLFDADPKSFIDAGFGPDVLGLRRRLRRIRERGYELGHGDVEPGLAGLAAPVFDGGANIVGALTLVLPAESFTDKTIAQMAERLMLAAEATTAAISEESFSAAKPAGAPATPAHPPALAPRTPSAHHQEPA